LERVNAAFAAFDSSMEVLRAAANAVVANYENRHLDEALNAVAEAFRAQQNFALNVEAALLNKNIGSINQQMNMLRSWQERERQVHVDLQRAEEFLRRHEDSELQIQREFKAG
jgi:ABC-type phosphate transport system auxiliary subunit